MASGINPGTRDAMIADLLRRGHGADSRTVVGKDHDRAATF
jgi:uncharacterized protein YoaH (UPF0181 family)